MSTRDAAVVSRPLAASAEWLRDARRAKLLAWSSLGWMTIEGIVAVAAGIMAGSIALIGFGISSAVEGLASVIVIWRFSGGSDALRAFGTSRATARRRQLLAA